MFVDQDLPAPTSLAFDQRSKINSQVFSCLPNTAARLRLKPGTPPSRNALSAERHVSTSLLSASS